MAKKDFNEKFSEICNKEKQEKAMKQKKFDENIKSHIVYMDDNGNITKDKPKHQKNKNDITVGQAFLYCLLVIALVIYIYVNYFN
mgnify:CR=1 FL=1